jgi:hypothetical protein
MGDDAQAVFDRVHRSFGELDAVTRELFDTAAVVIDLLPEVAAVALREGLDRTGAKIDELGALLRPLLEVPGAPWALYAAGEAWTAQVGAGVAALAGLATLDEVRADDHWQGVAADAYRNTLPRQRDALVAVKTATDELHDTLSEVGSGIIAFWAAVAVALGLLVLGLVSAIAAIAGVATALASPALATGALAAAIGFIGSANLALIDHLATLLAATVTLEQRLAGDEPFPGGSWPRSTADLSDGALRDGDDTDWHVR